MEESLPLKEVAAGGWKGGAPRLSMSYNDLGREQIHPRSSALADSSEVAGRLT